MHTQPRSLYSIRLAILIALLVGVFAPQSGQAMSRWKTVAPLNTARLLHTATLLPGGKLLVVGGCNSDTSECLNALSSVEVYDPNANSWTPVAPMNTARRSHTATLLPGGKVLVVGGWNGSAALASAEIYDPAADTWTYTTTSMSTVRHTHTATLLNSGKVLIAAGYNGVGSSYLDSAEVYDPVGDSWTTVEPLKAGRAYHTATLLPGGKVLIAAGHSGSSVFNHAEVYDPVENSWTVVAPLNTARFFHSATLLFNGKVLVAGGCDASGCPNPILSAEIYDPSANTWTPVAPLNAAHGIQTATLMSDGKVLVAGGYIGNYIAGAEVYDPVANTWTPAASLNHIRGHHTMTLLPGGKVIAAGGGDDSSILASVEVYDPNESILFVPLIMK
jgi:N-acetylneuraminic acid mutarotase